MPKYKALRLQKNLRAEDLIHKALISLSAPAYSLIENGRMLPTPDVLEAICKALDCMPSDLYDCMSEYDLPAVEYRMRYDTTQANKSAPATRFASLPQNPRIAVRLPPEKIEALESDLHVLGYQSFGQYVRKVIIPDLARKAAVKSGASA